MYYIRYKLGPKTSKNHNTFVKVHFLGPREYSFCDDNFPTLNQGLGIPQCICVNIRVHVQRKP